MKLPRDLSVWRILGFLFGSSAFAVASALLKLPKLVVSIFQAIVLNQKSPELTPSPLGSIFIIGAVLAIILVATWLVSLGRRRIRSGDTLDGASELYDAIADHGPPVRLTDVHWTVEIM